MVSPFWRATEHGQGRELSRNYSMTGSRLLLGTCLQLENMRSCCENRRTADPQERLKAFFQCCLFVCQWDQKVFIQGMGTFL